MAKKKKGPGLIQRLAQLDRRTWSLILLLAALILLTPIIFDFVIPESKRVPAAADPSDLIVIRDDADLLSDEEEARLYEHMLPVTKYGGAAFYTSSGSVSSAESYARKCFRDNFGTKSGTLFLIDMYNRQIYIFSDGRIYNTLTKAKARTITDNVYRMATRGDYAGCAEEVFDQIATLLSGGFIPQYMKHVCNALISFAIALLIVFITANARTRMQSVNEQMVFNEMAKKRAHLGDPTVRNLVSIKKVRQVEDSGGGGGGGSSGGGGGGGGGGSSGGGGGHGF